MALRRYATEALSTRPISSPFQAVDAFLNTLSPSALPLTHVHVPLESLSSQALMDKLVPLPAHIFAHPVHPSLFHLLVRQHLASLRQGTAANKYRTEVNASNKKIRKQKGTGKARLGDRASPMLRGGGRAFAKKPKDWSFHVPKKMVAKGLRGALSLRWAMGELKVIEDAYLDWPSDKPRGSTKYLSQALAEKGWNQPKIVSSQQDIDIPIRDRGTLIYLGQETLTSPHGKNLERASRNLPDVSVVDTVEGLKVYDLLRPSRVVLDLAALEEIIERLTLNTSLIGTGTETQGLGEEEMAIMQDAVQSELSSN